MHKQDVLTAERFQVCTPPGPALQKAGIQLHHSLVNGYSDYRKCKYRPLGPFPFSPPVLHNQSESLTHAQCSRHCSCFTFMFRTSKQGALCVFICSYSTFLFYSRGVFHYCFLCTASVNHPPPFLSVRFRPQDYRWLDIFGWWIVS